MFQQGGTHQFLAAQGIRPFLFHVPPFFAFLYIYLYYLFFLLILGKRWNMEQKSIKPSNTKRFRCSMSWNKDGTKVEHLYNFHIRLHTSISVFFIIPRKVAIFCWYFVRREEFSCDSRFFLNPAIRDIG